MPSVAYFMPLTKANNIRAIYLTESNTIRCNLIEKAMYFEIKEKHTKRSAELFVLGEMLKVF